MAIEPTYDVFLSHAASDTEAVAELARRLEEVGLKPFFPVQQIQVGMPWVEAIEKGLELSQSIAVFLGPGNVGPWQNEEMRAALETRVRDKSLRVIPVLLPGASLPDEESRPPVLVQLPWVDFRKGLDEPEPFYRLLAAIIGVTALGVTTRTSAPGAPPLRSRLLLPRFRLPRFRFKPRLKGVWLATAAPPSVALNSKFVARFSAYTEEYRSQVTKAVIAEAPKAKLHLDLHTCQWEPGTKVTVTLSADPLCVEEPSQSFVWNGKWEILKFDVSVLDSIDEGRLILRFDVFVEGLKIAKLRPELNIVYSQTAEKEERELEIATAPDKAFASYASLDRREVIGRIRSLQITGVRLEVE